MTVLALPYQIDLKIKSAGIGGFSDGGVKCLRRDLTGPNFNALSVDVGPTKGKTWRSFQMVLNSVSGCICVANNGTHPVSLTESVVLEDGTVLPANQPIQIPGGPIIFPIDFSVLSGVSLGGMISWPNKLRYTLSAAGTSPGTTPNGRVMLMILIMELDLLKDE